MSSNKEKETSSSSTESDLDFDISGYKLKISDCIMHLSSSSDEVNVTVNSEYEGQSQLSVDMPGPSNKTMETRFSATQELDTEFFNTDSENANPNKTPPDSDEQLNDCIQIFKSQDT